MRILMKAPGAEPHAIVIPNDLKVLQQLVGGYIETVTIFEDLVIVCDEEGKLKGEEFNCNILGADFVGTILFAGVKGEEFASVTEGVEKWVREVTA